MRKSKKIRIMHLNSYIGYDGPGRGIIGQAKYTDKTKFQNIICEIKSTKHSDFIKELKNHNCEHVSLNRNKFYDLSIIIKLIILLKKYEIDILNTHNAVACWYGNIAARISGIPVVFTLRGLQTENYKYLLKRSFLYIPVILLDRFTMMFADKVVAVSDELRKTYIENEKLPSKKIITIHNAIDLEPFNINYDTMSWRKKLGIRMNAIVVGIVGHLVELKGHECLIKAARIIAQKYDNIKFLAVGDGPLKNDLINKTKKYGISELFIWCGSVKDVIPLLSIMDIFVLPSLTEGLSRALMESMAMGMPSVCSAIDGNLEAVVDGETGFIFPVNDHESLADKLLFLIGNEKLRKEMGEKAQARAKEKFDMRTLTCTYEELYVELISARSPMQSRTAIG